MKIFLVYAHPEPQSMNGALYRTAIKALENEGHEVMTSDLYATNFNPVSGPANFKQKKDLGYFKQQIEEMDATETNSFADDIETELQKLENCDLMIWQFPLWWFGVPGILKGWADRVLAMGRTYGNGRLYGDGFFKGKKALLSLTTGGPQETYITGGFNGDLSGILRPIHRGIFEFVGFSVLQPHIIYGPVRQTPETREAMLNNWKNRLKGIFNEHAIEVGQY